VALVAFSWSLQHAVMPVTFDLNYMLYRAIAPTLAQGFPNPRHS
jgi:hypothetical protein